MLFTYLNDASVINGGPVTLVLYFSLSIFSFTCSMLIVFAFYRKSTTLQADYYKPNPYMGLRSSICIEDAFSNGKQHVNIL